MKDFYYILGIDVNCTSNEIREAYRKLSKKFHPDLNQHDDYFESRFKDIHEAYETLVDPEKRNQYDVALTQFKSHPLKKDLKKRVFYSAGVDVAFTVMLVLLTLLFGDYVVKTITSSKKSTTYPPVVVTTPAIIHHKKKHVLKPKSAMPAEATTQIVSIPKTVAKVESKLPKTIADTTSVRPVHIVPVANYTTKHDDPVIVDENAGYTAYIKSNATGIVYMRMLDNYRSDVVIVIPGNSKVTVLEKGNGFYKVMFNNKTGYVPKWTVKSN